MSKCIINDFGTKFWYNNRGQFHRNDGPAIESSDGTKCWLVNGKHHREDGPAVEHSDGSKYWYQNGIFHREDGPAIEHFNGSKAWYYNGKFIKCNSQEAFIRLIKLKVFW